MLVVLGTMKKALSLKYLIIIETNVGIICYRDIWAHQCLLIEPLHVGHHVAAEVFLVHKSVAVLIDS